MARTPSAGILLHRGSGDGLEVWIAHMGGPFWSRKDAGSWSIPKGEFEPGEEPLAVARREFAEENGVEAPQLPYRLLGEFRQSSGKVVTVFAARFEGHLEWVASNTFEVEWPPRSGRMQSFPEVDGARWVALDEARVLLVKGQLPVLDALAQSLGN